MDQKQTLGLGRWLLGILILATSIYVGYYLWFELNRQDLTAVLGR